MKNALELLQELCQAEFYERDAEKAAMLLSEHVCVIGTSDKRQIRDRAQALFYLKKENAHMNMSYHVEIVDDTLMMCCESSSVAMVKVVLEGDSAPVCMRVSAYAGVEKGESKLFSIHISVADSGRYADESYLIHDRLQLVEQLLSSMNGGIATFRVEGNHFYPEFVSAGVAKLLGMTVEEYKALYAGNIGASVYEADVSMLRSTVEAAMLRGESTSLTYRSPHKDGSYIWINGVFSKYGRTDDGKPLIQAIFTPASQQFSSQINILDATNTGIYIIDRMTYELYYINKAGFETLKAEPCSYLGRTCYDVMHHRTSPCEDCILHSAIETGQAVEIYTPDLGCTHLVHAKETDWNGKPAIIEYLTDITELKQTEEQLRSSKKRLESRIELERQKPFSNREALLGYVVTNLTKDRVISHKRVSRNMPTAIDGTSIAVSTGNSAPYYADEENRQKFIAVHDRDALLKYYESGGTSKVYEFRRRLADGSVHWVKTTMDILCDPISGDVMMYEYCHDIDLEKKDRIAIDSLVDDEIDYIIMVNARTGKCHLVRGKGSQTESQSWENACFDSILKAMIASSVCPEDQQKCMEFANLQEVLRRLDEEGEIIVTYRKQLSGDEVAYKVMRAFYIDDTHADFVIARRDVTDVYDTEKEQRRILQESADVANAANQAKSEFMSNMSHDMRTPLNGILGLAYLMSEQTDMTVLKQQILQLQESGEYLLQLINDVLDVSRIESGKMVLEPKICNEELLFSSIIEMVMPLLKEKNIDFHFEKIDIEWQYMLLDEQRVKQIFINLLSNAIKFTPDGGRIDFIMQLVSQTETVIRDRFVIKDNGIGISQDFLPHIFETFRQENRGHIDANNGTGLGLPIVKQLVELMDGTITVESIENQGTEVTVYINFPLAQRPAVTQEQTLAIQNLAGRHILLCEDQPLNAKITKKILEIQRCEVTWAENGKAGLEKFQESPVGYYHAILMDIRMPVMDGLTATKEIRKLKRSDAACVPIIALSANAYDEDTRMTKEAGMNAHLAKPFKPDALFEMLAAQILLSKEQKNNE
ncbi:MAG: ATP-binding protein [bacterium]|nr:ATP-binding protein [bacterium]